MSLYVQSTYWNTGYGDLGAYQAWLEDPSAIRVILVVATVGVYDSGSSTYVDTPLYFSTQGFVSNDGFAIQFNPIITGTVELTESLNRESSTSISFGDIQLINKNGELDEYLDPSKYLWVNKSIQIYHGDASWINPLTGNDFFLVLDGVIRDIDAVNRNVLNIKFLDKLEQLNTPVTENKIGTYGTWASGQQNMDTIRPIVFGEVFNMTPVLIDPATLEYAVSTNSADQLVGFSTNGAVESIIEIRDNGVPIYTAGGTLTGAVVNLANGTFKLTSPAAGGITASVQGIVKSFNTATGAINSTYDNNIASHLAIVVTQFGKSASRFTADDIDLANFNYFYNNKFTNKPIGVIVADTTNVLGLCKSIAGSVGCQLFINSIGKLQLLRYGDPYPDPLIQVTEITENDMLLNSFSIASRSAVEASSKVAYAKNWTKQANLLTSIPDQHKESFDTEWLTTTSINSTAKDLYNKHSDPVQKDTYLITTAAAVAEADRIKDFYSSIHTVYKFTGTTKMLGLQLGQQVTLYHSRYGLSEGVSGQVVSIRSNWTRGSAEIEVLV